MYGSYTYRALGEKIGTSRVDAYGDDVLCVCQALPGDGWRVRHDRIKPELLRLLKYC